MAITNTCRYCHEVITFLCSTSDGKGDWDWRSSVLADCGCVSYTMICARNDGYPVGRHYPVTPVEGIDY